MTYDAIDEAVAKALAGPTRSWQSFIWQSFLPVSRNARLELLKAMIAQGPSEEAILAFYGADGDGPVHVFRAMLQAELERLERPCPSPQPKRTWRRRGRS